MHTVVCHPVRIGRPADGRFEIAILSAPAFAAYGVVALSFPGRLLVSAHTNVLASTKGLGKSVARILGIALFGFFAATVNNVDAASFDETYALFVRGEYEQAQKVAAEEVERGVWNRRWPELLIRCHLMRGEYAEALKQYDAALKRFPSSLSLRLHGIEAVRHNNLPDRVRQEMAQFELQLQRATLQYASRDTMIAAGRYFVMRGEDARLILESFYDRVIESDPKYLEAYIAIAELGLSKGDYSEVSKTLARAKRLEIEDPRVDYLLAQAFSHSDRDVSKASLQRALTINPNHIPSLMMQAEEMIDRERYTQASEQIEKIFRINSSYPEAIALQAVIAHLEGDYKKEKELRKKALESWPQNPNVDHLIGKKLSQKYRFAEGAEYQRKALISDPKHAPASFQLAQDLLRMGSDEVGWQLAETVSDEDPYNVVAFNLMALRDQIKSFKVLSVGDIRVRMDSREAVIYGREVLALLAEARQVLCKKYEIEPDAPIMVEIFPRQKDFAIRTFGLPGGEGFLGVCFGRVITANSPASQGARPANWKSVLWHEFCHVVTLEKTKNRMPRWLSEGISVYEERLRDPSWGQSMTPQFRTMILDGELTKVSELSGAFLSPPSGAHLQFAYYESSLVVEFLIEKHGLDSLKEILVSLADGLPINDALGASVGSIDKLDVQFAEYAKELAEAFAPDADWSRDGIPEEPNRAEWTRWLKENPKSYWGNRTYAELLMRQREFEDAKIVLEQLGALGGKTGERGGTLEMLTRVYQSTQELDKEKECLQELVELSSDALPALRRLMSLAVAEEDWQAVIDFSDKALAIQPLVDDIHQQRIDAALKLDRPEEALNSLIALRAMEPIDVAGLEYKTARAFAATGDRVQAKRHVLLALTQAPRYRDAHRLLLELTESPPEPESPPKPDEKKEEPGKGQEPKNERKSDGVGKPEKPSGDDDADEKDSGAKAPDVKDSDINDADQQQVDGEVTPAEAVREPAEAVREPAEAVREPASQSPESESGGNLDPNRKANPKKESAQ